MENHKFITARFINNDRTTVEIEWQNDAKELVMEITEAEEDNLVWIDLLTHTSLDDIHETTINHNKEQRKIFEDLVMHISQRDPAPAEDLKKFPAIVAALFNHKESEDDIFALKLALFELKEIRGSKNTAVKSKLRKSKTMFDILRCAFDIIEESTETTSQTTPSP